VAAGATGLGVEALVHAEGLSQIDLDGGGLEDGDALVDQDRDEAVGVDRTEPARLSAASVMSTWTAS